MKYDVGDLVEIVRPRNNEISDWIIPVPEGSSPEMTSALILYGHPTSVYVEDRPVRSISTVQYSVMCEGRRLSIYEEEISRQLTVGRDIIR